MTLKLTLKEPYYSLTGEQGKMFELRKQSQWILSRLQNKDGTNKKLTHVKFTNGYNKNSPTKTKILLSWDIMNEVAEWHLPNKEIITTMPGDIVIWLE